MENRYDLVVIGGGIAGLAISEIFSRSGFKVALVEKNDRLCMEASGVHHEWFHFGSLYSIFPNSQFLRTLVGGIDDLLVYYRDFEGMNLRVTGSGELITIEKRGKWFRDETIDYIVSARNDPDFELKNFSGVKDFFYKLLMLLSWERALKKFIARHNRFYKYDWRRGAASHYIPRAGWYDYSRVVIEKFHDDKILLDPDTHFKIKGYDKPMHARSIVEDLIRSLCSTGGDIFLDTSFVEYKRRSECIDVVLDGQVLQADKLILAAGKGLKDFDRTRSRVDVVVSPLLVVYPNVCDINFVRLTPFVKKTINHIKHFAEGRTYSLIGGGYYAPRDDPEAKERVKGQLLERAKRVFPLMEEAEFVDVYFGDKTEVSSSLKDVKKRNYLYRMEKVDKDVYFVVPGKFSLGFSLAVNAFKELVGHYPNTFVIYDKDVDVSEYTGLMKHRDMVIRNAQNCVARKNGIGDILGYSRSS